MPAKLSKKLRALDDFLLSDAVGEDAMLLSELDGFLAGLVVAPDLIMPSEWLGEVWGEDDPAFDGEQQIEAVIGAIMGHFNDIIRQLDRNSYSPIYDIDDNGDDNESVLWETWIAGFWRAAALRPESWVDLMESSEGDLQIALFSLTRLHAIATTPSDELEPLEIDEELEDMAPGLIPHAVGILHRERLAAAQADPQAPFGESAMPKVGRNDPCPCGSGKKFKKCCLN